MKFQKLTPNLVVRDVAASMEFYRTALGFQPGMKVPDEAPYVFGSVTNGGVEIFFNDQKVVAEDYPALAQSPSAEASRYSSRSKASRKFSQPSRRATRRSPCP